MATNNPFEKLSVKREDDDEEENFKEVKTKSSNVPYGIESKKKKVRPQEPKQEDNEGFEEVGKGHKLRKQHDDEDENPDTEHKKRKGVNYDKTESRDYNANKNGGKTRGRKFDRHSGTGRGKESSKGGAGGKGTWGDNPKTI